MCSELSGVIFLQDAVRVGLALGCRLCSNLLQVNYCVPQSEGSTTAWGMLFSWQSQEGKKTTKPRKHIEILYSYHVCSYSMDESKCMTKPRFRATGMCTPSHRVGESEEWMFAEQVSNLSQFLLTTLIPLYTVSSVNSPPLPHLCVPSVSCWHPDWYYVLLTSFYSFSRFLGIH